MGIWFLAHNSVIFCPILMKFHIRVQKTTSYKYGFWACSGYLAKLGLIWTKYGRGCPAGTVWRLGSGTPSKVRSLVLVCWSTAISKSSFTKKYPLSPPPLKLTWQSTFPILHTQMIYLSSFNHGGLNLAVFRQFRHILTRHYFYPP